MRKSAESILNDAKTFYKNMEEAGKICTYHDYEKFKHILHDNGWFGYEFQLAKILHI